MPLILLTSFITALAVLAAWPVKFKPKLFFFLILIMDGGQIAVFAVQDMLLFFLTWELELIPVYLLLAIWGGKNRQYAATKFIIYTAGSSIFILLAALAMGFYGTEIPNFEFSHLANVEDSRTLVIHPASATHSQMDEASLKLAGMSHDMIRLSVGLEDFDDIVNDFENGFRAAQKPKLVANK